MKTIAELKMSEESQRVIFWWNIQLLIDILISFKMGFVKVEKTISQIIKETWVCISQSYKTDYQSLLPWVSEQNINITQDWSREKR